MFMVIQHNVTVEGPPTDGTTYFTSGWKDICTVFFYFLICIVVHALVQEYILDVSNVSSLEYLMMKYMESDS